MYLWGGVFPWEFALRNKMNCASKDEEGIALGYSASLYLFQNREEKE